MSSSVVTPNASACSNRPGNAWVWASMSPGSSVSARRVDHGGVDSRDVAPHLDDHAVAHQHRHPRPHGGAVEHPVGPDQQGSRHRLIVPAHYAVYGELSGASSRRSAP